MSKYSECKDFTYPSADGKTEISAKVWEDEKVDPRAIVQISHGMLEYKERYNRFAKWMASRGILVCANDHLGHGESVSNKSEYGYITDKNPSKVLLEDMHELRTIMQEEYPDLPYFILGHSMGSYLLRAYIAKHGHGLNGAIIMGTGAVSEAAADFGIKVCDMLASIKGWHYKSKLVESLTFGKDYKQFDTIGKDKDNNWLTRDREVVVKYYQDPKCTYKFTLSGYRALFESVADSAKESNTRKIPAELPMLLISGRDDPVGSMGKGVEKVYDMLKSSGHDDIEIKLYDGARHEVLNEINKEDVFEDLRSWVMKHIQVNICCIQGGTEV